MALTVLFGKAGSGKSQACYQGMQQAAAAGKKVLLLVPDQATYGAERSFAQSCAGQGFLGTRIVGFSRLAYSVFAERGLEHASLSELSQKIILQRLLRQREKDFTVLQTAARQPNFALTAVRFLNECRSFCITPEALHQAAARLPGPNFSHKLEDLALLYESYEDFLAAHFGSADDSMTLLGREVGKYSFLQDALVWVDGFQWFTPQQLDVLTEIEKVASQMTLTLTLDAEHFQQQRRETGLFHRAYEVYQALKRRLPHLEAAVCNKEGSAPLTVMRHDFFQLIPRVRQTPVPNLQLTECSNRDTEIEAIARKIVALTHQGYRYRDFLLLARTSEDYHAGVTRIFARYGIPCFSDYRRPMVNHPAAEVLSALLDVFYRRWSHNALFRLLKSDLFPLPREAVDKLENYCLAYGLQGSHWQSPKKWDFGSRPELSQQAISQTELEALNTNRAAVVALLLPMQKEVQQEHTLCDWCSLLYQWLQTLEIPSALRRWQEEDTAAGRTTEAKEHEQVWKKILAFLNEIVSLCGEDVTDFAEFRQLVEDGLATLTFSLIPPTLDHVTLTSVERGYTMQARVVFLCGLNDGIFPQHSSEEGLLSDRERQRLQRLGLTLAPGSRFRSLQERFLFYLAVSRAREKLYLSYNLADSDGGALEKAAWLHQLVDRGYVAGIERETGEISPGRERDYLLTLPAALAFLPVKLRPALSGQQVAPVWWALYDWGLMHGYGQQTKLAVQGLFHSNLPLSLPLTLVRRLFAPTGQIRGSVTKFEQYRACPFAYFSRYGLKLEERRLHRFAAPDLGLLVHGALRLIGEKLLREKKQWQDLEKEEIPPLCRHVTEQLAPEVQHDILMSNAYFTQIKERLIRTLIRTVQRLKQFSEASDFRMTGLEKSFGQPDSPWRALHVTTKNGLDVIVTGQIDRIDTLKEKGRQYVVIIDYKSGRKKLDLSQIFTGQELQLLTYMFVALLNLGETALPAAILYCYVRNDRESLPARLTEEEKQQHYEKQNKLNGFYLDDSKVMQKLDTSLSGRSDFLNLQLKKDGSLSDAAHTVYNEAAWSQLLSLAQRRIGEIGEAISAGDITMKPLLLSKGSVCDYCPYQPVCRFDPSLPDNVYSLAGQVDKKTVLKKIFGKGDDDLHDLD